MLMLITVAAWAQESTIMGRQNSACQQALYPEPMTLVETEGDGEAGKCQHPDSLPNICAKEEMQSDGIVRLSRVEVYPEFLQEYMKYAREVGEVSLRTEPGVLTMYAMSQKDNPCMVTILETYTSQAAYRSHIASAHFQKYKQGTLKMVKSLRLVDQTPLNPSNTLLNFIK